MKKFLSAALLLLLVPLSLSAEPKGKWNVTEENDYFKLPGKDNEYTQGIRIGYEIPDETGSHTYYGGQNFYTPPDKRRENPDPDSRPYAAWLYGGYDARYLRSNQVQDRFGIQAGMVGPSALGEETQRVVHEALGQYVPAGWKYQLHDEPGVVGIAERADRTTAQSLFSKLQYDTISTGGANLGNISTQAYIGSQIRVGYNLQPSFGIDTIFPRVGRTVQASPEPLSIYFFGGPVGRAVVRNIFLDGNTFRDSRSVDKYPFVAELRAGLGVSWDDYKFQYTYTAMTDEYKTQRDNIDFGSLSFTWSY